MQGRRGGRGSFDATDQQGGAAFGYVGEGAVVAVAEAIEGLDGGTGFEAEHAGEVVGFIVGQGEGGGAGGLGEVAAVGHWVMGLMWRCGDVGIWGCVDLGV